MRTTTSGKNQYGVWTKNTNSTNLADGSGVANDIYRKICALKDWPFLEQLRTITTTAATAGTALPYDCDQVREIAVTPVNQTKRYTPAPVKNAKHWDELNLTSFKSDIPEYYYVFDDSVYLWPTPVSTGNTIRVTQKTKVIDLTIADITSSTVVTATNGSNAVVLSGGVTPLMAGMWIQITYNPSTTNTGDGLWYQIIGITGTTQVTLSRNYGGTSIVAGSAACTIGQAPLLPEAFHDTPWKGAAVTYWKTNSDSRADAFNTDFNNDLIALGLNSSSKITDFVIDRGEDYDIINPNLTITL